MQVEPAKKLTRGALGADEAGSAAGLRREEGGHTNGRQRVVVVGPIGPVATA